MILTPADNIRAVLGKDGFIRTIITAKNTEDNVNVHRAFLAFCKAEFNDDYTTGLKVLLQAYEEDFKYASLRDLIVQLRTEVDELKIKIE